MTAADRMRALAGWLEEHPTADLQTLRNGPVAEALTLDQLEGMAGNEEAIAQLAAQSRASADAWEAKDA